MSPALAGEFFFYHCITWEAPYSDKTYTNILKCTINKSRQIQKWWVGRQGKGEGQEPEETNKIFYNMEDLSCNISIIIRYSQNTPIRRNSAEYIRKCGPNITSNSMT